MIFRKKQKTNNLYQEVDDSRQIVYDFRRRTYNFFENYRTVGYKKLPSCDFEKQRQETAEVLNRLIAAQSVDAGNADCLIDKILGQVRDGVRYLDDQYLEHQDFYTRQGERMKADLEDLEQILNLRKEKIETIEKEHEVTQKLWEKYCGYQQKEA